MAFRVGQKVVCVDASQSHAHGVQEIVEGAIYTVRWAGTAVICGFKYNGVRLCGVLRDDEADDGLINNADQPFDVYRFRPIVERKTDISFAHEILRKVSHKDQVRA